MLASIVLNAPIKMLLFHNSVYVHFQLGLHKLLTLDESFGLGISFSLFLSIFHYFVLDMEKNTLKPEQKKVTRICGIYHGMTEF